MNALSRKWVIFASTALAFTLPSQGWASDPYSEIPADEAGLELVFDKGNKAKYLIKGEGKDAQAEHIVEKISKLYGKKPKERGQTLAWKIKNEARTSTQARKTTVLLKKKDNGRYALILDRRRGKKGNNPNARKRERALALAPPPAPRAQAQETAD